MDYNEYDSNGNKKRFSFDVKDKKTRSRFILLIYAMIFLFLIIFVRTNYKGVNVNNESTSNNNNINNQENENKNDKVDNNVDIENKESEINEMFSFIDLNNYEFKYTVSYNDTGTVIEGKKYNNKYDFSLSSDGSILHFNGSNSYIKAKIDDEDYKLVSFPYVLVNYFDNKVIEDIVINSDYKDGFYEITNGKLGELIGEELNDSDNINKIELITKNNKVVKINLDFTSAISSYSKENVVTKLTLEYSNFGLVEDFKLV